MIERPNRAWALPRIARHTVPKSQSRLARTAFTTLPILLAGSMAISLNVTGPIGPHESKRADKSKDSVSELRKSIRAAMEQQAQELSSSATAVDASVAAIAPSSYRVTSGDTVSGIAARYGLATASVLALNGLGWKSIIFPGQILKLTMAGATQGPAAPEASVAGRYTIVAGDTISGIAARYGISTQSVLTANGLSFSSIIYPGQSIAIPGHTAARAVDIVPVVTVSPISTVPLRYTIKSGDTISHIAAQFGVSVSSILAANGLQLSSIIYADRSLIIPATTTSSAGVGDAVAILSPEMEGNARTIISVGRSLGVSDYGLVIALAAAMQESTLLNLDYGDRDSLGLFQQRPSQGWGNPSQVTNTTYASKLFFGGPANPNGGDTAGLLDITGWQSMTVTQAAQAVQRSAYPDAYAKWEVSARAWLNQLS